jgi:hypothetical protein
MVAPNGRRRAKAALATARVRPNNVAQPLLAVPRSGCEPVPNGRAPQDMGHCVFSPDTWHLRPDTLGARAVVAATLESRFGIKGEARGPEGAVRVYLLPSVW